MRRTPLSVRASAAGVSASAMASISPMLSSESSMPHTPRGAPRGTHNTPRPYCVRSNALAPPVLLRPAAMTLRYPGY
jgi:hypothetical protein